MQNSKVFDLKERSLRFSLDIIKFIESLENNYIARTLGQQLLRSATSIGANIIEAQAAPTRKDFANFYNIALKSANETKYWLSLIAKSGYDNANCIGSLEQEAAEIANILAKSLITLRGK